MSKSLSVFTDSCSSSLDFLVSTAATWQDLSLSFFHFSKSKRSSSCYLIIRWSRSATIVEEGADNDGHSFKKRAKKLLPVTEQKVSDDIMKFVNFCKSKFLGWRGTRLDRR